MVEVADVEDTPKATRKKKRRNPLKSQKSNAIIVRSWVTRRNREVVDFKRIASKIIPNLPILGNSLELRGIMVNMGRIHRELRNFLTQSSNLIKSDEKLMVEIGENDILRKKTSNRFYEIKNHQNRT